MSAFSITMQCVLQMLIYLVPGFIAGKTKKLSVTQLPGLSTVLLYICTPALFISTFLKLDFSLELLKSMCIFFVITLILQLAFICGLIFLFRKQKQDSAARVMTAAGTFGNAAFFGIPLLYSLFPDLPIVGVYASIFCVSMDAIVYTVGVYCVSQDKKAISFKAAVLNPSILSFAAGLILFCLGAKKFLPDWIQNGVSTMGTMATPVSMFILGARFSAVSMKRFLGSKYVWLAVGFKQLVFPLLALAVAAVFPLEQTMRLCLILLCGTPCAAIVSSISELHRQGQETAANCVILSTLLSVITMPLLALLIH